MHKSKKILSLITAVFILLYALPLTAIAENGKITTAEIPDEAAAVAQLNLPDEAVGTTITVKVSASDMLGTEGADLAFKYDETALEFVSVEKDAAFECSMATGGNSDTGVITYSFVYTEAASSYDSGICEIKFNVLKAGETQVSCHVRTWYGCECPSFIFGTPSFSEIVMTGEFNDDNILEVTVSAQNTKGLESADIKYFYDSEKLEFIGLDSEVGQLAGYDEPTVGCVYQYFAFSEYCNTESLDLCVMKFKALDLGDASIYCQCISWDGTHAPDDASLNINVSEDKVELFTYHINSDGGATIDRCNSTSVSELVIPDEIDGYKVTAIDDYAFYDCGNLKSVTIGDNVKTIGYCAFEGCYNLSSLSLGGAVETIEDYAFEYCSSLKSITIPDSVKTIGGYAFSGCEKLESVTFGKNIENIDYCAFENCLSLKSIAVPDSVKSIGAGAFCSCPNLSEVSLGSSLESISESMFYGCGKLADIDIPDSVQSIEIDAFFGCEKLASIKIGDGVKYIGSSAFYGTQYYNTEANWENGVLYIGDYLISASSDISGDYNIKYGTRCIGDHAFYSCEKLTGVKLPDTVEFINAWAFKDCINLASAQLDDGVKEIGDYAFDSCVSLASITIGSSIESIGHCAMGYSNNKEDWSCDIIEGFVIFGTSGTAAEEYAIANDITFNAIGDKPASEEPSGDKPSSEEPSSDSPVTDNPVIEEPATDKPVEKPTDETPSASDPTTENPPVQKPTDDNTSPSISLKVSDRISVNENDKYLTVTAERGESGIVSLTASALKASLENENVSISDKNGKELDSNALVGTGATVRILDSGGNTLSEYKVTVPTDVSGDGKTTAADARLALRGAAKLEAIEGVYSLAADTNTDEKLTAADARLILRRSANLE